MKDLVSSFEKDDVFDSDSQKIEKIALEKIMPDPNQVRQHFDEESISELADSIREHGLQNPIHIIKSADGNYTILTGERRYRAAKKLGLEFIPCIVHEEMDETKKRALQLIENLQRKDLTVIETAKGFKALLESGLSQRSIARQLGLSDGYISKVLSIFNLPSEWLQEIESHYKSISFKELYEISGEKNKQKRAGLYQKLMASLGKEVEIKVEQPQKRKEQPKNDFTDAQYEQAWENLKKYVRRDKSKLSQLLTPAKLQLILDYADDEE